MNIYRLYLILILTLLPYGVLAADTYQQLIEKAEQAKKTNKYSESLEYLKEAKSLNAEGAEAWHLEGVIYTYKKQYKNAIKHLNKALELDKDNYEIKMSLARTYSWQGNYQESIKILKEILSKDNNNPEAQLLLARVYFYTGDLSQSENKYSSIAKEFRDNNAVYDEAKKGLSDVRNANDEAWNWKLDLGYGNSNFSRIEQPNWQDINVQLNYRTNNGNSLLHGRYNSVERFENYDTYYEFGLDHKCTKDIFGYFSLGGSPEADFLPRWKARLGGSIKVPKKVKEFGDTFLTLDTQYDNYEEGNIKTINPGLQYYVTSNVWLTGKYINVVDDDNKRLTGWFARGDWQVTDNFRVNAGLANAPETVDGITVDTSSVFFGLAFDVNKKTTLYLGYGRDDRKDSYINKTISSGLSVKF